MPSLSLEGAAGASLEKMRQRDVQANVEAFSADAKTLHSLDYD